MQIIVWHDKHSTKYYDASSVEAWDASAIEILKELTDEDYGYLNPAFYEPYVTDEKRRLAETDISNLPAEVLELIEKKVLEARADIARQESYHQEVQKQYDLARQYIEDGKSPTFVRGKGTSWETQIPDSWNIIQDRNGGEYERFELEDVFTIYDYGFGEVSEPDEK